MSRISDKKRQFVLKRKRGRSLKMQRLKLKYLAANSWEEKKKIIEKLAKIAPHLDPRAYLEGGR